jgi:hypothetical protein
VRTEFISTTDILGAVKDLRTPEFQQGMAQIAPFQEYEHEASPPAEDEGDDADNSSEEEGNDVAEVKRIVEENWPGGGEMIVQSEHNNPHSPLGVVYSKIPEVVKVAFGYLSAAYGAIATRYPGRHLVFTPGMFSFAAARTKKRPFEEFSAFKNAEEGGILVRAGGLTALTRVRLFAAPEPSQSSILSNPNTPITLNAPSTPISPWTFPGPASSWMPAQGQQQSSTARKVRRILENEHGTAILCSMKICPSLDPEDFREVRADDVLSLCSSRYWAAKAPPFKVELRINPSQSKAATDTGSSRNATTPFCEVAKFQRNNVSTKKTQQPIYSQNHWQSVHNSRPREDGRGCVVRLNKRPIQRHRNTH